MKCCFCLIQCCECLLAAITSEGAHTSLSKVKKIKRAIARRRMFDG